MERKFELKKTRTNHLMKNGKKTISEKILFNRKKTIELKKKIINHLMKNGKKTISEKILFNSIKELQKISLKQPEELIKNAIINTIPMFKIKKIEKKRKKKKKYIKEIPLCVMSKKSKISLAIKLIKKSLNKQSYLFKDFHKEILLNNQQKGNSINLKFEEHKKIMSLKYYSRFYRWR
jgi:small subunit ribosomal protein S7